MVLADVLLHPGFHKTGTTYLQNVLFADSDRFGQPWSRDFIDRHIIRPHPLAFDGTAARDAFQAMLPPGSSGIVPVLSEEGLSGNPFNGAREAKACADKLATIFPAARVLLTVRRQTDMIRAVYVQYLKAGGRRSLAAFIDAPVEPEFFTFDATVFSYHRLADHYAALFGPGSVVVLPQEYMRQQPAEAIAVLGRHVGIADLVPPVAKGDGRRDNYSPPLSAVPLLRGGNHFVAGPFNETALPFRPAARALRSLGYRQRLLFRGMDTRLRADIARRFAGSFAASNHRLQEYCPVELGLFGYDF